MSAGFHHPMARPRASQISDDDGGPIRRVGLARLSEHQTIGTYFNPAVVDGWLCTYYRAVGGMHYPQTR
jgi:hypothetical protein